MRLQRIVVPPKPDLPPPVVVDIAPKAPPSGMVIGVVREMRPSTFCGWPPPSDDDDPSAA